MNIYGNDGNLIFCEGTYEIIDTFNDVIEVKTNKNGIFRVKLTYCDGMDVKVLPNDISVVKEEETNKVVIGGKTYSFVTINGLDWLTENLALETTGSEQKAGHPEYGNFYPTSDFTEIASKVPEGWRVPNDNDIMSVLNVSSIDEAGTAETAHKLQKLGVAGFENATGETGFDAIPVSYLSDTSSNVRMISWGQIFGSGTRTILIQKDTCTPSGWENSTARNLKCVIRLCRTHV